MVPGPTNHSPRGADLREDYRLLPTTHRAVRACRLLALIVALGEWDDEPPLPYFATTRDLRVEFVRCVSIRVLRVPRNERIADLSINVSDPQAIAQAQRAMEITARNAI